MTVRTCGAGRGQNENEEGKHLNALSWRSRTTSRRSVGASRSRVLYSSSPCAERCVASACRSALRSSEVSSSEVPSCGPPLHLRAERGCRRCGLGTATAAVWSRRG